MDKKILNANELFPKIIEGTNKVADIVAATLGPGGRPILLQRLGEALDGSALTPSITKDGVSVALECHDPDPELDLIIQTVKSMCRKTVQTAGDGTTTSLVLGRAILRDTLSKIRMPKVLKMLGFQSKLNPNLVKEEVEKSAKKVIESLKLLAKPVKDIAAIKAVATISANGDESIGNIIAQAFAAVGAEGVVTVDEGVGTGLTLSTCNGYSFKRGCMANDRFFNDKEKTSFKAENARLIIYDGDLLNSTDLIAALMVLGKDIEIQARQTGKTTTELMPPIVIMANEFSNEVLQWLLIQKDQAGLQFCAIKGPHQTTVRTGMYDDIAVYCKGKRMGNGNRNLRNFEITDLGTIKKIVADKYTTTIFGGAGTDSEIIARVDQLKAAKIKAESSYDAQVLNDRIAALTGGVAKIGVGGQTELAIKEKYDRIEDALNAARVAIEEGVIVGAGLPLYRIALELEKSKNIGDQILSKSLKDPFNQILANVGLDIKSIDMKQLLKNKDLTFDARNKKIVNAFEAGILDPFKVTRTALENAISIAALLSTAGGAIIYTRKM